MHHPASFRNVVLSSLLAAALSAQVAPIPGLAPVTPQKNPPQTAPPAVPTPPPQGAPAGGTATKPQAGDSARVADTGGFMLNNVSLVELIDILARRMKINYILDPRVKGTVTIYTYGEVRPVDLMPLMETVLRVNGATMVKVGELYRIVPTSAVAPLPIEPQVNVDPTKLPEDERIIMNMVFLKFVTVAEISKLIQPFLGEGATVSSYEPANLLIILDNARSMRRTMNLLAMFDSDSFAGQRVRLLEVSNGRPSDLAKELDSVFKAYALSEKTSSVRFIPVDRINTIIAVAPNPGVFADVEKWLKKLDVPVKITAGAVNNYLYRLKYGRAEVVASSIQQLYGGFGYGYGYGGYGMGAGMGYGGMGFGGVGFGATGYGGMGYGGGYPGATGYAGYPGLGAFTSGAIAAGSMSGGVPPNTSITPTTPTAPSPTNPMGSTSGATDQSGQYLGYTGAGGFRGPRIIPNPTDNTILVQGTPQEWEQILRLLEQLDVMPRQVLIDAKIFEVDLTGAFSAGVSAALEKAGKSDRTLGASSSVNDGVSLTTGALVLRSHELMGMLTATENKSYTKVIASPSLIATDSVAASLNVGQDVPTLTSQAVAGGLQAGGSSLFTNTISMRSSGVTLSILARITASGIVTMVISQDVSQPQAASAGSAIQSPSFTRRSFQTQVTVQDGDTIAIGGIIQETDLQSSGGVPILHRIPILGAAFGGKTSSKARTELVVFLTPRVIYDSNQIVDATAEITGRLKRIKKLMNEQQ